MDDVLAHRGIAIMLFVMPDSFSCRKMTKVFSELESANPAVLFKSADVSDSNGLDVKTAPTVMIFKDGKLTEEWVGVRSREVLQKAIERLI